MDHRRFQLIAGSLLLVAGMVACVLSPAASSGGPTATSPAVNGCANVYFPDSSGTSWTYSSTGSVLGPYTNTVTVTESGNAGFTTSNQYSTGLASTIKWNCQDGNLSALDSGADSLVLASPKYKYTITSVTAEGYNIPSSFTAGTTWSEKVTAIGTVISGTQSTDSQLDSLLNCSITGTDSVTVPAGTFDTVKASCTDTLTLAELQQGTPVPGSAPSAVSITNWYARGVGLVKSVRVSNLGGTNTILLTQYAVP